MKTIEILTTLMSEEATHVSTLPSGSEAALRFEARREALQNAIVILEATFAYRRRYGPVRMLKSVGDSTARIELFEIVDEALERMKGKTT